MAKRRKNISARRDIDSGVLRQRRDMYAISIALMLYYLAGGELWDELPFPTT